MAAFDCEIGPAQRRAYFFASADSIQSVMPAQAVQHAKRKEKTGCRLSPV
jgi:hypothetical protein